MSSVHFERVLTTGGSGMIGTYVDFGIRPSHQELDITNEAVVRQCVQAHKPETIIHLAAAADMARCEREPSYAYDINVRGTYNLAQAASEVGARMVFLSSSRVFKGDKETPYIETDIPKPETQYGRTKYIGEILVKQLVPQHIIVRTAWVFGGGPERDNKFYGAVLKQLQTDAPEIVALRDVIGSPTYGKDLVQMIQKLLMEGSVGTYHITNTGTATRYDIAQALVKAVRPEVKVRAVERSYFPGAATLPENEAVVSEYCKLRPWQEALSEYVAEEWSGLN